MKAQVKNRGKKRLEERYHNNLCGDRCGNENCDG